MDCGKCDAKHVVHNGSVRNYANKRSQLATAGHDINTPVDSEIIGHKVGEIPDSIEDHNRRTYNFRGNLNYLVFAEDGILVRVSDKYHLADNFTMTCRPDELDAFEEGTDTEWMRITPGGNIETKERVERQRRTSSTYRGVGRGKWGSRSSASTSSQSASGSSDDTHSIEYNDLIPDIDGMVAVRVSPRDIKLINTAADDKVTTFINRDADPEEFYYYAEENAPDNLEQLARIANSEQTQLDDVADSNNADDEPVTHIPLDSDENEMSMAERKEAAEAAERAVVAEVANEQNITLEEAADIADGVSSLFGDA